MVFQSKRSQITVFMIIGIVILAIFGFLFFSSGQQTEENLEKRIDIAEEKIRETNILRQYVTLCLKNSLQEGLILAGKQGGMIEAPQEYAEFEGYKVGYGIRKQEPTPELPGPPEYPCINKPGTPSYQCGAQNHIMNPKKPYPFGKRALPYLCDPEGPNAAYLKIFPFPCPIGTYGRGSLQEQLNLFVETQLPRCVNLTPIAQVTGLNITSAEPNVSVVWGEEDVVAKAAYPLNISLEGYGSMRFFDFQVTLPVRMKKIFGLADYIAKNEIYDIEFVSQSDFTDYRYFMKQILPFMKVSEYCPLCAEGEHSSIIEINDSVSVIEGKPFVFRFAIENRIPALDPIQYVDVTEGDTILIEPIAYDADNNDIISYSVSGWKENEWAFTGQYLEYATQEGDAGDYEITVYACDQANECDWQLVGINVELIAEEII